MMPRLRFRLNSDIIGSPSWNKPSFATRLELRSENMAVRFRQFELTIWLPFHFGR